MTTPLQALKAALPSNIVATDESTRFNASFDALKRSFLPDAVITPSEHIHIGTTLTLANQFKVPVTTRGAGSSLTGSATPINAGWVIDTSLLNNIHIDALNYTAHVQAGATTSALHQMALAHNLFYPPDPASSQWCTLGGNIACNAGGMRCLKYGVTRDYVSSLSGYLPTGQFVRWAKPLKKFASGYNLRDLWIGSEGTLGIITHATLKLISKPQSQFLALANFKSDSDAIHAAINLIQSGIQPSTLEFMDNLSIQGAQLASKSSPFNNFTPHATLLIELDGHPAHVQDQKTLLRTWAKSADNLIEADNPTDAEALWQLRKDCSSGTYQLANAKLNEDIVVPLNKMPDLIQFIAQLRTTTNLKIPIFGHAGDGNLHVNILYDHDNPQQTQAAESALDQLMQKVTDLDGAISGEHGIGLAKSSYLHLQHTQDEINAMKAIKQALDPNNILNPNKIFTPFQVWNSPTTHSPLPWDHD